MRHRIKKTYSVRERDVSRIENKRKLSNYLLHRNTCFYQTLKEPDSVPGTIPQPNGLCCDTPTLPSHETRRSRGRLRFAQILGRRLGRISQNLFFARLLRDSLQARAAFSSPRWAADSFLGKVKLGMSGAALVVPSLALLLVLGGLVFPGMVEGAYAETDNADNIEPYANTPAISLTLPDYDDTVEQVNLQKQVTAEDNVGHLTIDFNVRASNIDKYDVYVQSTSSALIGEANGERVESINADTLYANMKNQAGWGYAVSKGSKVNAETLTYKPIQTGVNTSADTGSATNTTINQPYTLAFAANLSGVSADHYMSNVILSVAAGAEQTATLYSVTYNTNNSTAGTTPATQSAVSDSGTYSFTVPTAEQYGLAKEGYWFLGWSTNQHSNVAEYGLVNSEITLTKNESNVILYAIWATQSWNSVTQMQQLTTEICGTAPENATKQLIDMRDNNIYWVAKLKDGNCWMTQNMAYEIDANGDATYSVVNKNKVLNGGVAENIGTRTLSMDSTSLSVYPTATTYNGHYRLGNYYARGQRNDVCTILGSDWRLPTASEASSSSASGSFGKLFGVYGVADNASGSAIIRGAPMFFIYGGVYNGGATNIGNYGTYWSSTNDSYNLLYVSKDKASPRFDYTGWFGSSGGYSVRCVVLGN